MADQQQPPAPPMQSAQPAPRRKGFIGSMSSSVAAHPQMALAVIIVLIILVVGLYVYYHGFLFLGPYAKGAPRRKGSAKAKKDGGSGEAADDRGDPETERLIDAINHQ